jgi:hypothetical protein
MVLVFGVAIVLLDTPGRRKRRRARAQKRAQAAAPGDEQTLIEHSPEQPDCILLPLLFGFLSLFVATPLFAAVAIVSGVAAPARTSRDRLIGALIGLAVGLIDLALIVLVLRIWLSPLPAPGPPPPATFPYRTNPYVRP